jgi:hypothetical protein
MTKWKRSLEVSLNMSRITFDYEEEKEPLLEEALKHCPSVKKEYDILKERRDQYELKKTELAALIAKESPREATEQFARLAVHYSILVSMSDTYPTYKPDDQSCCLLVVVAESGQKECIARGSGDMLEKWEQLHRELVGRYSKSEEVQRLAASAKALRNMETALHEALQTGLLKREHAKGKCEFCPG